MLQKICLTLIFIFTFFLNCIAADSISNKEATDIIVRSTFLKFIECGNSPGFLLYVPKENIYKNGVNTCAFTILRTPCPFTQYPLLCLELYRVDVPGYGPRIPSNFLNLQ